MKIREEKDSDGIGKRKGCVVEKIPRGGDNKGSGSFVRIVLRRVAEDIKSVRWALLLMGICFFALWAATGRICPMAAVTGFPCPGCGLTRAGLRALTLDFSGAWEMNPFIFPIAALILLWCIDRYLLFRKPPVWFSWCAAGVLTSLVLFYVWRMIHYFPGEPPMNYEADHLLSRLSALWE